MIGSVKDEHQIWDSSAILSSHILFVYTGGTYIYIYTYIVCMPTLCIMYTVFHIIHSDSSHVFYSILLQTHDLASLPGERLAQWWRNTISFSTWGVVQMWDHATLKGPGGYNTKFQCEQTKFQHVLHCNPVCRFSCHFALSNSSSQIRVKWVDFSVTYVCFIEAYSFFLFTTWVWPETLSK